MRQLHGKRKFISSTKNFRKGGGGSKWSDYINFFCHFGLANKGFRGYFGYLLDFKSLSVIL